MRRVLFVYMLKAVRCGLSAIWREQLGSAVVYQGRRCFVSNWAGGESPTLAADGFYEEYVPRAEIRNLFGPRELIHRFVCGFEFYSGNWMSIDIQNRLMGKWSVAP